MKLKSSCIFRFTTLVVCFLLMSSQLSPAFAKGESQTESLIQFKNKWAVLVGINSFKEKRLNKGIRLDEAAIEVKDLFVEKYNFDAGGTFLLTNEDASRQSIKGAIGEEWLGKVAGADDLAVVFVNTICFPSIDGKTYLCCYDTDFDNFLATCITVDEFFDTLNRSVKCKKIVVVMQTLFNGIPEMMSGCRTKFGVYNIAVDSKKLPDNMVVIASSKSNQPTWGTYFSDNLVRALKKSEPDTILDKIFKKTYDGTVTSTINDCKGCKIQTPEIYTSSQNRQIVVGCEPSSESPVKSKAVLAFEDAAKLSGRALKLIKEGKSEEAFEVLTNEKLYQDPASASDEKSLAMVDYLKGKIYQNNKEYENAKEYFELAIKKDPGSSVYYSSLASVMAELKKSASEFWMKAYQLDTSNLNAIIGYADDLNESDKSRKAIDILKKALAEYPQSPDLHDRLSLAYSNVGNIKAAIQHAQEVVFLDDTSWSSFINLGSLLLIDGSYNEAQVAFRQALELNPDSNDGYFLLARALEKTKDPEGAIEALNSFIKLSSKEDKRMAMALKKIEELKKQISSE